MKIAAHAIGFVFTCLFAISAHAGAWTQKTGTTQIINTTTFYTASRYFDVQGKSRKQLPYHKQEVSTYAEYGLYEDVTLGGQFSFIRAYQENATAPNSTANLGDSEIFVRKRVWKGDLSVVSLQPGVVLPSPDSSRSIPKIGADRPSVGLRASYGRAFKTFGQWDYAELSGGYLHRIGKANDQISLDATVGINLNERWQLMPQAFLTKSRHQVGGRRFTESSADDYDLLKAQFSVQYTWQGVGAFQLGAFSHLYGKNTGEGKGLLARYIRTFP